jgi:transposase-like protein
MNETERSAYCREHGLYVEQIDDWKDAFETVDSLESPTSKADVAGMRKQNRHLKKELHRKEKALAETAALLALSKKSQCHLGHRRGRMIPMSMKQMAIQLIEEAVSAGARRVSPPTTPPPSTAASPSTGPRPPAPRATGCAGASAPAATGAAGTTTAAPRPPTAPSPATN